MALYVLDTDILSLHQHAHPVVAARIAACTDPICLSAITLEEQMNGWLASLRAARTPAAHAKASAFSVKLVTSWSEFVILPTTEPSLDTHAHLLRLRLNVGGYDLRIAAVALDAGAVVVTRNRRDFGRVPGLTIEDWSV